MNAKDHKLAANSLRGGRGTNLRATLGKAKSVPLTGWIGLSIVAGYAALAVLAPSLAPYGEAEVVGEPFAEWSKSFPLGTDQLGRDMLSRLIFGARNTIGIAVVTTSISFAIGVVLGLMAAVFGRWVDQLTSRLVDVLMAIPQLVFALVLLVIMGPSLVNLVAIIAVLDSTRVFRLTRAVAMNVVALDFVESARLQGERVGWIMMREVLPNILAPLVAEFGLRFCFVFLMISALSFLGLGIQPPMADWGSMVRDNAALISYASITPLLPALAIAVLTVGVNFVVDWFLHNVSGLAK